METNSGRYSRDFLEMVLSVVLAISGKLPGIKLWPEPLRLKDETDADAKTRLARSFRKDITLAYATDSKVIFLDIEGKGWGKIPNLIVNAATKIGKRLPVVTRLTALSWVTNPSHFKVDLVNAEDYMSLTEDERTLLALEGMSPAEIQMILDGGTVISRQLLAKCLMGMRVKMRRQGFSEDAIRLAVRKVRSSGTFEIRILTPDGLWKAHAMVHQAKKPGFHLRTTSVNLKNELMLQSMVYVHLETVSESSVVFTDTQTLSWMWPWTDLWGGVDVLRTNLRAFNEAALDDLREGRSAVWESLGVDFVADDHASSLRNAYGMWKAAYMSLKHSRHFIQMAGGAHINRLDPPSRKGKNRRFPIPNAVYVHVATEAWLRAAGYTDIATEEGEVWFHVPTQRLIYNDLDFIRLFDRHGGWDLDDAVKVLFVLMGGELRVIIIRSPNGPGEFDVKRWRSKIALPKHVDGDSLREIGTARLPYLEELNIQYKGLPSGGPKPQGVYTKAFAWQQIIAAMGVADGVYGRWANAQMLHWMHLGHRSNPVASSGDVIDSCVQEIAPAKTAAIVQDTDDALAPLAGAVIDRTFWRERYGKKTPPGPLAAGWYTQLAEMHKEEVAAFRRALNGIMAEVKHNIPKEIFKLGKLREAEAMPILARYEQELPCGRRREHEDYQAATAKTVHLLTLQFPEEQVQDEIVVAMAAAIYSGNGSDGILFQDAGNACTCGHASWRHTEERCKYPNCGCTTYSMDHKLMSFFDIYVRALKRFGIEPEWRMKLTCRSCGIEHITSDRATHQRYLEHDQLCTNCR